MKKLVVFCLLSIVSGLHAQIPGVISDELEYVDCTILPKGAHSLGSRSGKHASNPHMPEYTSGTSTNWSGYVAATKLNNPGSRSVTGVTGSWTVPTLSSTAGNSYCAIWVGIDGYSNSTVEQIGTGHDWVSGSQSNYAWFEMYPQWAYEIVGFPVNDGDVITASVQYQSGSTFVLSITNVTHRVTTVVPSIYTKSSSAKRSSAEWIVEAPYENGVLPLSDFGVISMTNCSATINNTTGKINNSHWQNESLTMVTSNHIVKALPSNLSNGNAFTVTWEHE